MNDSKERRSSIRRPIHHEAILHLGTKTHVPCVIADYCADGMFLKFDRAYADFLAALEQDDLLDLSFKDTQGKSYHIGAHLAHVMSGALGIRFTERRNAVINALVIMNRVERKVPGKEASAVVDECIVHIQSRTLPLMTDMWPVLIEEIKQASVSASSDQQANALMASANLLEKNQRELQAGFSMGIQDPLSTYQQHLDTAAKMNDTLSLVDKNEFEDWLISRVLITKAETQYRAELLPLKVRLDAIGVGDKSYHQSVFGPALLVSAFHSALVPMGFGIGLEKTIFKVFENSVIMSLDDLYEGLNKILAKHNIMPDLDMAKALKSKTVSKPAKKASLGSAARESKAQAEIADTHQQATTSTRHGGAGYSQAPSGNHTAQSGAISSSSGSQQALSSRAAAGTEPASSGQAASLPPHKGASFIGSLGGGSGQADSHSASLTAPPFQQASTGPDSNHEAAIAGDASFQQNQADAQHALENVVGLMRSLRTKSAEQNSELSSVAADAERYSEAEIAEGLSELQVASDVSDLDDRPSLMERVKENLQQQGADKEIDENQKVAIDVVDRFFYSMRNNPRISSEAKQHLLKLEVPVLKVLLKDDRFFDDHNSSVRAVMNRIAQLGAKGATLNPSSRRRVSDLVEQIVDQFEQDTEVFDFVLGELDQLIDRQNNLYVKNVERVAAAADGVHKVDEAKVAVAQALNQRLANKEVPAAVNTLIENGWKDLLNLTHIKFGEDSEEWQTYLSVLDRLIAFGENPDIPVDTKKIIPVIQEGLKLVSGTNEASSTVRASLKQLIQNAPRGDHSMVQAELQELPETEDEVVQRNLHKSQVLKSWIVRAKSIEPGTWLKMERENNEPQYMRLVWIAKGYSKFVFVNHQGMKVIELGLLKLANYLKDKRIVLEFDYEVPIVNQSLDNMVAEVYDKLAYETNYDEGSGLIKRSEFCRQVRSIMKTGKRTAECYLLYIRFYDGVKDKPAELSATFAKDLAESLKNQLEVGIIGRMNESDFVLFVAETDQEFLSVRCQDVVETLCETESQKLAVLIGESKAHMGFYNPESMIRHALALIEDNFETVKSGGLTAPEEPAEPPTLHEEDSADQGLSVIEGSAVEKDDEPDSQQVDGAQEGELAAQHTAVLSSTIPSEYIDESANVLPEDQDFSALELELMVQKAQCIHVKSENSEAEASNADGILVDHLNLLCFIKGSDSPFDVNSPEEAKNLDAWWLAQLIGLKSEKHPTLEDATFVRVQISGYALSDPEFTAQVTSLSEEGKITAKQIGFDIYDCAAIGDIHSALGYMNQLKELGFKFCLDHFGSERSPFAFLKALPFDIIKIDESFMEELNKAEGDEAAADSIIEIAHYLGKRVLANEVDSAICLQKMQHLKVDFVQGSTVAMLTEL